MKFPAFEPIDLKNDIESFSICKLPIKYVIANPSQPRKKFDEIALLELASSIEQYGIIQPILVKKLKSDQYQIIAGERRWRASLMAELTVIPAIIQNNKDQENVAISLIENIQREELNPIELARSFYQLNHKYGLSHEAIGSMIGKSRATVTNLLRLLNLPEEVMNLLIDKQLEMGHARTLLTLSFEQQSIFARKIVKQKLSVRNSEKLVQRHKFPKEKKHNSYAKKIDNWIQELSYSLSSKVSITLNERGEGKVVLSVSSPDEVDWLVEKLARKVE